MSLEERTLVVRNLEGKQVSISLLEELFSNFGPVVKIVLLPKNQLPSFCFVEFSKKESVGYAWTMTTGLRMFGRTLNIFPKLEDDPANYTYHDLLTSFENRMNEDKPYVNSLLTPDQVKEKNDLLDKLNSRSPDIIAEIGQRLRQYEEHWTPKSTYNAILDRDLAKECGRFDSFNPRSHHRQQQPNSHQRSHSLDRAAQRGFDNQNNQHNANNFMHQHQLANSHYHSQPDLSQSWHAGPPDFNPQQYHQQPPHQRPHLGNQPPNWGQYEQHNYEPPHGRYQHHQQQYQGPQQYQPPPHQYGHFPGYYPDPQQQPQAPPYHHPHPNSYRPYPPPQQRRH